MTRNKISFRVFVYFTFCLYGCWFLHPGRVFAAISRLTSVSWLCLPLAAGRWFSPGTPVSSTNKTDRHYITEILLKVTLNTITSNLLVYDLYSPTVCFLSRDEIYLLSLVCFHCFTDTRLVCYVVVTFISHCWLNEMNFELWTLKIEHKSMYFACKPHKIHYIFSNYLQLFYIHVYTNIYIQENFEDIKELIAIFVRFMKKWPQLFKPIYIA
jgi:hypothetical protein